MVWISVHKNIVNGQIGWFLTFYYMIMSRINVLKACLYPYSLYSITHLLTIILSLIQCQWGWTEVASLLTWACNMTAKACAWEGVLLLSR